MKKSVSNVVAGGLITSATVMSANAVLNTAEADFVEIKQTQRFNFNFNTIDLNTVSLTCCYDITGQQDFVFDGFDEALGVLNTATLEISLQGLFNDPDAMTCCYDLADVVGYDGQIAGQDLSPAIVRSLGTGSVSVMLDPAKLARDLNTATLDFNILFNDKVFISGDTGGEVTLSYSYEPSPVPLPGGAALLAPALAALFGVTRRRRRKEEK